MTSSRVAIVGAGIAGLSAARALVDAGCAVTVLDKGRRPGGRTCTRASDAGAFDHGAQYFTARERRFAATVAGWRSAGVVAPWEGRIVSLGPDGIAPPPSNRERFVGVPGMGALAAHLARDLDVRNGARVAKLFRTPAGWELTDENGGELGTFAQVLVTAPPAQAAALIGEASPLGEAARATGFAPTWAAMLAFETPHTAPFDAAFCDDPVLAWIARDSSKPERDAGERWVLHAQGAWSEAHLDDTREAVAEALAEAFHALAGAGAGAPLHARAHLWRYARPTAEPRDGETALHDAEAGLALAGDGYAGGRVEGAWVSGRRAAELVLADG